MKVCGVGKQQESEQVLTDLLPGTVFRFRYVDNYCMRTKSGYVCLDGIQEGLYFREAKSHKVAVCIVYPNACINPGEPR